MGFRIKNGVLEKYTEEPGVTEVVIPDSVTSIGKYAFSECGNLTSINIPDSVTFISEDAFANCTDLRTIIAKTKLLLNAFGKTALEKPIFTNDPTMLPQKGRVLGHNKADRGGI